MEPVAYEYVHDDFSSEDRMKPSLRIITAGGDYYLQTVNEPNPDGPQDTRHPDWRGTEGPLVRIRTSGSPDPRNQAVCLALAALVRALEGAPE